MRGEKDEKSVINGGTVLDERSMALMACGHCRPVAAFRAMATGGQRPPPANSVFVAQILVISVKYKLFYTTNH